MFPEIYQWLKSILWPQLALLRNPANEGGRSEDLRGSGRGMQCQPGKPAGALQDEAVRGPEPAGSWLVSIKTFPQGSSR